MAEGQLLKKVTGREKTAIIIGALPEEKGGKIFSLLDDMEKEILISEIRKSKGFDKEIVEEVLNEFVEFVDYDQDTEVNTGEEFALRLLRNSMEEEEADKLIDKVNPWEPFKHFRNLQDITPIKTFLQNKDPQMIACVVSYLKHDHAGEVLRALPKEKLGKVTYAVATMDQTNVKMLEKMDRYLEKRIESMSSKDASSVDGEKVLVDILNSVDRATEKEVFENLEKMDEKVAKDIKDKLFVFEDFVKVSNMGLQKVLNAVTDEEKIALALKLTTEEIKAKFYSALTKQRKRALEEVEETMQETSRADVESAQQEIADIAKEMEKKGEIMIKRGEDDVIS